MFTIDPAKVPQPFLGDHPDWVALYHFAWKLAGQHVRQTKGRWHIDLMWEPGQNLQWVWDTCFVTMYGRYAADQFPAMNSLDNFYDLQRADGFISMTYDLETGKEYYPARINPPLFAWAEWEYYRTTADASRLAKAAKHIERFMDWIDANRRTRPHWKLAVPERADFYEPYNQYQLYYFEDSGSSGMDDSPRTPRLPEAGEFFDWIDLSSQMALSFDRLAKIHAALGHADQAKHWATRARDLGGVINAELWCDRTLFYHDRFLPRNFVASKTAAGFWPMLAGICPSERVAALVGHLLDEREFNRPTPVPALSADDPNYSPQGVYWCGGVWPSTNYMITRGLMLNGRADIAHGIAMKYLGALARTYAKVEPHTLWEVYSAEEDLPGLTAYSLERVKGDFVGWTGIGPIAMLIENVLGLDIDAPGKQVTWTIRLTEEHGIRRLPVGPGVFADFYCAARTSADAPGEVRVRSDAPLTVHLESHGRAQKLVLRAGQETRMTV